VIKPASLFWSVVAPLVCVVVISAGQILFKMASASLDFRSPFAQPRGLAILAAALVLYASATLLWVAALQHAPLSRLYPVMALSFLLVPLGGMLLLGERVSLGYWAGAALIVVGLAVIGRSWAA
jgi:drug/metabolite transporter (DMT)-like permease